jgi:hypothetical protein
MKCQSISYKTIPYKTLTYQGFNYRTIPSPQLANNFGFTSEMAAIFGFLLYFRMAQPHFCIIIGGSEILFFIFPGLDFSRNNLSPMQ